VQEAATKLHASMTSNRELNVTGVGVAARLLRP
jgi:hypothetical protein